MASPLLSVTGANAFEPLAVQLLLSTTVRLKEYVCATGAVADAVSGEAVVLPLDGVTTELVGGVHA
jgi:hypothetical protein